MSGRKIAFLFPGQASQYPGMGRELSSALPEARATFEAADRALGMPLTNLCFEGPEAELALTENTQPAILTVSVAAARALADRGVVAEVVAGHSLGEYSALVAAGSLPFEVAVRLVRNRGRYMQESVAVGVGAMAAIIGLGPDVVAALCAESSRGQVVVAANFNSPDQTVVAGHADAVRRLVALAEARGARKGIMLPVSAPFHSPLMEPAQQRLRQDLDATTFSNPRPAVMTNVDADYAVDGGVVRESLIRQVTAPVRWSESMQRLLQDGFNTFVEVGPGRVLLGLLRRIDRNVEVHHVEDIKSLEVTVKALGEGA